MVNGGVCSEMSAWPHEVSLSALFTWERETEGGAAVPAKPKLCVEKQAVEGRRATPAANELRRARPAGRPPELQGKHSRDTALRSLQSQPQGDQEAKGRGRPQRRPDSGARRAQLRGRGIPF